MEKQAYESSKKNIEKEKNKGDGKVRTTKH